MQTRFTLVLFSLLSSCQPKPQWTEEMIKTALEKAEIPWNEAQKTYADSIGNLININYWEHDLNDDGETELLVEASGSYYLWGSSECFCFVIDQDGEILVEVIGREISVMDSSTDGYGDIKVESKRRSSIYRWKKDKYIIENPMKVESLLDNSPQLLFCSLCQRASSFL